MPDRFPVKTAEQRRDDMLRTWRNGFSNQGVNANVTPGSELYILAQGLADQMEQLGARLQTSADDLMPDTAVQDSLARHMSIYGLSFRDASGSIGLVVFSTTSSVLVTTGAELVDGAGLRYAVSAGGTYANGDLIPITAVDLGESTNHAAGDIFRWTSPPGGIAAPTVVVATGGLTGGVDAEDDETARARLLDRLRNPPGGGNWSQCVQLAEASHPSVQKAAAYPALYGPATLGVTVWGYITSTSKSRVINGTIVSSYVAPFILAGLPQFVDCSVTTVSDVPTDIAVGLALPAAVTASPAGPGGGWTDGSPWPMPDTGNGYQYADVTGVTSTTAFRIRASRAPTPNVSQISWLSPVDWTVYTAIVTSTTDVAGLPTQFEITLDRPLPNIAIGHYVSPNAVNVATYFASILDSFAKLGPGERGTSAASLARGFRHPLPSIAWPYSLGNQVLRALSNTGDEVLDVSWTYRSTTTPAAAASVTTPPNILIPRNVAVYAL